MILSDSMREDVRAFIKKRLLKSDSKTSVDIMTPFELSQQDIKKFQLLYGGNCVIKNSIDPSLIGGFVLRDGSTILDGSIKGELDNVVNSLLLR